MSKVSVREINPVGKRIRWCREQVNMLMKDVAPEVGIALPTLSDREGGVRAIEHEEYLALAQFFNEKWKEQGLNRNPPIYKGTPIKKVSVLWIMFGIFEE